MERWVLLRKGADYAAIAKKYGISPRLACLIRNREVIGDQQIDRYLNGTLADLYDGMLLKGMDQGVEILMEKIQEGKKIRIIGDYDIDGVNATYILLEGLEYLGAQVDYDIPHRIEDGYGLNQNLIERAYRDGVDTIVTCDNGIAATEEIAYGKKLDMTIVVTDHHEVPYVLEGDEKDYILPPADAVIDPKQPGCEYPFKGLCGAAVAYKLIEALCEAMGRDAYELDYLLENVAIATVGDVMELEDENRIIVKEGLQMLGRTYNKGLKALIECNGIDKKQITAYHIGFVLGPCLNASGRLDSAKRAVALLRAANKRDADMYAGDLKAMNDSRKNLTLEAVKEAKEIVEASDLKNDRVLVIFLPECHESLAGIVAGKVREAYYRPVFVLTNGEEGVKGSGRSIEGYHMYEELNKCQKLLTKFGGHKLAAGLSLEKKNVPLLRKMLNENCTLTEKDLQEKVTIDMEMPLRFVTEELVEELKLLEPFGNGNRKPVFAVRHVEILSSRILGKNKNVLKMTVRDGEGTKMEAMLFSDIERFFETVRERYGRDAEAAIREGRAPGIRMMFTYYPDINEYMGRKTPQITISHYQ